MDELTSNSTFRILKKGKHKTGICAGRPTCTQEPCQLAKVVFNIRGGHMAALLDEGHVAIELRYSRRRWDRVHRAGTADVPEPLANSTSP